jgi:hypothetical protein
VDTIYESVIEASKKDAEANKSKKPITKE